MLEINNLNVAIGTQPILKGIDLHIRPGEVHAIMDPMVLEKVRCLKFWRVTPRMRLPR